PGFRPRFPGFSSGGALGLFPDLAATPGGLIHVNRRRRAPAIVGSPIPPTREKKMPPPAAIPAYLNETYWWAYVHPKAVKLFERQWLVNLILWGNYEQLRDATLAEMGESSGGPSWQVACVYGDLTSRLSRRVASRGGVIDVVD